jgi:predicted transcriptional regulator
MPGRECSVRSLTTVLVWLYHTLMATTTIKSTYSLDVDTVRALDTLAHRWRVSKSEALRRAIRIAAHQPQVGPAESTTALDALQRSLKLTTRAADRWRQEARSERRKSELRRRAR